jgi:Tfp pilus assembly protein PilN
MNEHENLLPIDWQRRLLRRRRLRQWALACLAALVLGASVCAIKFSLLTQRRAEVAALEGQAEPLQATTRETIQFETQLAELAGRESLLTTLDGAGQPFQLLGIISSGAALQKPNLRVVSFSMQTQSQQIVANAAVANPVGPPAERVVIQLEGISVDNLAVASFVNQLRQFDVFDEVNLRSTDRGNDDEPQDFLIGCHYGK